MAHLLRSMFRAWLPPLVLSALLACAGGSSGGSATGGGGAVGGQTLIGGSGNYANVPVQDPGVAVPGVSVEEEQLIYYSLKMSTVESAANGNPVKVKASGQLTDCQGVPFAKSELGRYIRQIEPVRRQFIDVPVLEGNRYEAIWELEPGADPATQFPKVGSAFRIPIRLHGSLVTSPQACPLAAPGCLALDIQQEDPWLALSYVDSPGNLCTISKNLGPISNSTGADIVERVRVGTDYRDQTTEVVKPEGTSGSASSWENPLAPAGDHFFVLPPD